MCLPSTSSNERIILTGNVNWPKTTLRGICNVDEKATEQTRKAAGLTHTNTLTFTDTGTQIVADRRASPLLKRLFVCVCIVIRCDIGNFFGIGSRAHCMNIFNATFYFSLSYVVRLKSCKFIKNKKCCLPSAPVSLLSKLHHSPASRMNMEGGLVWR